MPVAEGEVGGSKDGPFHAVVYAIYCFTTRKTRSTDAGEKPVLHL